MRTKKEQEAIRSARPKAMPILDEALFGLLMTVTNDNGPRPDLFAGRAQSQPQADRLRLKRLMFGTALAALMIGGMWLLYAD